MKSIPPLVEKSVLEVGMQRRVNIITFMALLSLSFPLATVHATTSSTDLAPPPANTPNMVNCPKVTVMGTRLISTTQTISSGGVNVNDPKRCVNTAVSQLIWAAGITGSSLSNVCPTTFPYLNGLTQTWKGVFQFGGQATMVAKCCTTPFTSMAATNEWVPGQCP